MGLLPTCAGRDAGRAQVVTSRTITANARTTANLKANANIGRRRVTAVLELTEKPGALRPNPSTGTGRSCQKGSRCGLYRVPEIVTRGRFPDGDESDSTWRTQEARHVGSDTIAPGF